MVYRFPIPSYCHFEGLLHAVALRVRETEVALRNGMSLVRCIGTHGYHLIHLALLDSRQSSPAPPLLYNLATNINVPAKYLIK